jgi:formylglycine-generating enzyme required for sulfatase activity
MSSLADLPELIGFFSYSRDDDDDAKGALSALRERIHRELRGQLGRSFKSFRLWQDKEAITPGKLWEAEIRTAVGQSVFFIPIITPTVVKSPFCKFELDSFLAREQALGRADLVFPILYIDVPSLEDSSQRQNDPVLSIIAKRQYVDWREYRHRDVNSTEMKEKVEWFCKNVVKALRLPWLSPEERRTIEEDEVRERAERGRLAQEAEAKQRAEEALQKEEAEARRRTEEERRKRGAAEKERGAEEARLRKDAEIKRRAEEDERRTSAELATRQRAEEERAFAAAKRADAVSAVDKFLADYPESHLAGEARALRLMLLARGQAHRQAMASDDPAVLKAFLDAYPRGAPADEVRRRLRRFEPRQVWRPSTRAFVIGGVLVVGAVGIWLAVTAPPTPVVTPPPAPVATAPPSGRPSPTDGVPLSPERERALKPKDSFKECAACREMVVVPAGTFTMGSPESEPERYPDESPQHGVAFARQLAVGRFAVTFDEWDACAADGGCGGYKPSDQGWGRGRRPVINVSWDDAKAYVVWLSNKIGKTYRLLSESEREYVTRAGTSTPFWWGSSISTSQANYNGDFTYGGGAKGEFRAKTLPVDTFQPNPWGFYQVHGNVMEWVQDCWQDNYNGAPPDGSARTSGDCNSRVLRGGSWLSNPQFLRSANRYGNPSGGRISSLGFRVGRTLTP